MTILSFLRLVPNACAAARRRRSLPAMLLAVFTLGSAGAAHGSPILYTLSGIFSGSLGSTVFTDTAATFTFTGDTSDVQDLGGGFSTDLVGKGVFTLSNGPSATFLSTTYGVESEYGAASFMDTASGFAIGEYNESTPSDVLSVYGNPTGGTFVSYGSAIETTSLGGLSITGATGDVTFQASRPVVVASTPEPMSLLLTGTGVLSFASVLRRRGRKQRERPV